MGTRLFMPKLTFPVGSKPAPIKHTLWREAIPAWQRLELLCTCKHFVAGLGQMTPGFKGDCRPNNTPESDHHHGAYG